MKPAMREWVDRAEADYAAAPPFDISCADRSGFRSHCK